MKRTRGDLTPSDNVLSIKDIVMQSADKGSLLVVVKRLFMVTLKKRNNNLVMKTTTKT